MLFDVAKQLRFCCFFLCDEQLDKQIEIKLNQPCGARKWGQYDTGAKIPAKVHNLKE